MGFLKHFVDIVLHLDKYLSHIIQKFGNWTYLILFVVIFSETGLVVFPFLPGDSLIFTTGVFAATGAFDKWILFAILGIASIAGDNTNYWIGNFLGPKVFHYENSRFFNREHLLKTHKFYEKYGGKTIIIAKFIPIIRTFTPFVAGIGSMTYPRFLVYDVIGGISWISIFMFGGYYFGNIPVVRRNFTLVIFLIIIISTLPGIVEYLRHRSSGKNID